MATALLAAAGTGERLGAGTPKALVEARRPPDVLVVAARRSPRRATSIDVVIAAPPDCEQRLEALAAERRARRSTARVVAGGASRSHSVSLALAAAGERRGRAWSTMPPARSSRRS